MSGVSLFTGLIALFFNLGLPLLIILVVLWLYRIKQNSDIQIEQNKEIIQLLKNNDEKSNRDI